MSEASIVEAGIEIAQRVEPVNEAAKAYLIQTPQPVHFDETGARVVEKLTWIHVASTAWVNYLAVHPRPGTRAHDEIGILPQRTGWSIHDGYRSYFQYLDVQHGLCNAHHLRDLNFIQERDRQEWADRLADLLVEIKDAVAVARQRAQSSFSSEQLAVFETQYAQ